MVDIIKLNSFLHGELDDQNVNFIKRDSYNRSSYTDEFELECMTKDQIKKVACLFIDYDIEFKIDEGSSDLLVVDEGKLEMFMILNGFDETEI
jgi:hypothetical protein